LSIYEDIPKEHEIITLDPFSFRILTTKDAKIELVKVTITGEKPTKKEEKLRGH